MPMLEHIMNEMDVQAMLNPNLIGPRLEAVCGRVGGRSFSFSSRQLTSAPRSRIMRLENLIEDHPMTALGNVPSHANDTAIPRL
jgi:hypothetical protein